MAYASVQNVLDAYPKVQTIGITRAEVEGFIRRADAIINGYLAAKYAVPVATTPEGTPPLVNSLSVDLAMVDLLDRFPNQPEWIANRIQRAYDVLKLVKDGEMAIVGEDGSVVAPRTDIETPRSNTENYVPVFGGAIDPSDTRFDPSRVADEEFDRVP